MFRLMILSAYLLPGIYTYFRLRHLLSEKIHKVLFTVFYIILMLSFPLTEFVSHGSVSGWIKYLVLPGYYSLPFLLYLFLLLLVFDLFLGVNRLVKLVPAETLRGRNFRLIVFWVIITCSTAIVAIGAVHLNTIRVAEYKIAVPRGSAGISHLRIAMAADFHLGQLTRNGFLETFAAKINALQPDILLIPGDIVEGHRDDGDTEEFARQFRRIKTKYGIYASPGNHESHGGNNTMAFFAHAGIEVLADRGVAIDNSFCLVGRNDRHYINRIPINRLLDTLPPRLPVIVLDHRPVDLEEASMNRVDIQVSGHTHYGQLFPLNFIIKNLYRLPWGYTKIRGTHFFVTSGIQVWGPPIRTAGNSEIMMIDVEFN